MDKDKFIIGRWYKYKNWYIKYKETVDGIFVSSEEINNYKNYKKCDSLFGKPDHEKVLLEDLSEIQEYLPEGHPDKISSTSKFKVGDWIMFDGSVTAGPYQIKSFRKDGVAIDQNGDVRAVQFMYRFATPEEIPVSSIPEYVECIEDFNGYGIKGRTYKFITISGPHWGVICNLKCDRYNGGDMLYFNPKQFKPSTKEDYDAQLPKRIPKYEEIITKFKVGDFVISDIDYLTLPCNTVSQILEVFDTGRIKLKEGEFNSKDFKLVLSSKLVSIKEEPMYSYVGDPLPKTKPLIENVQSISVNLRTKKTNNKFKF